MGLHAVPEAEAKHQLSDLIDRALRGEEVEISRAGRVVVALKPVESEQVRSDQGGSERLEALRRVRVTPEDQSFDSAALLRRMRDGED